MMPLSKVLESDSVPDQLPRVPEFYNGKSVFLTGATGLVGSVLLETLLRCCPGIKSIFLLVRTKKNVDPETRKEIIFSKKIFEKVKKENADLLGKVCVIAGDITLPKLGLSKSDTNLLLDEVSIVFNCAASLNFTKPLEFMIKNNVLSLDYIIKLCRKMKKFEVLVQTSTAYSNCNRSFSLKEVVYRLPSSAEKFVNAVKNEDKKVLLELASLCKPDWPNTYTFSKCLAENLIADTASDLAVAIVRPSIIHCTWKDPFPGYWEEHSGIATLTSGSMRSFLKIKNGDPESVQNYVPSDIVAKSLVLAAWSLGTKRCASPFVVNCTATENLTMPYGKYCLEMFKVAQHFPVPGSFSQPTKTKVVLNKYIYYFLAAFYHYIPATVLDGISRILKKQSNMYSYYCDVEKLINEGNYFLTNAFEFERHNLENLDKMICPEDRKNLSVDFEEATLPGMLFSIAKGSFFYDCKFEKKYWDGEINNLSGQNVSRCIQCIYLMIFSMLVYWVLSSIIL